MSTKKKILILLASVLLIGVVVLLASLSGHKRPIPAPTPSETATSDPLDADRALVQRLSSELAGNYYTYNRPDDQAYLDSIQPFLENGLFNETARLNQKYAAKVSLEPIRSTVKDSEVTSISKSEATAFVNLSTAEGGQTYMQGVEIHWLKTADRWVADSLIIRSTTKGDPVDGNGP